MKPHSTLSKNTTSNGPSNGPTHGPSGIVSKIALTGLGLVLNLFSSNSYGNETAPAHHDGSRFRNIHGSPKQHSGVWPYLKMRWFDETFPEPTAATSPKAVPPDLEAIKQPQSDLQVTWIGHASALVQIGGKNILTDPVFEERASPLQAFGAKRYSPAGLNPQQLPQIDFVAISHNHYDHLERATVERIGNGAHWLVPLGLKKWFAALGVTRVTELDWWQQATIDGVTFTLTPTQHWSRRGIADTNATLWGSWAMHYAGRKVWFGGDTGYSSTLFQEIGKRVGPFDLALIPIGGYGPRWFMHEKHADPHDAVAIHKDLQASHSIAIHWGTFVLTSEPVEEPPALLAQARTQLGVADHAFQAISPGQLFKVPPRASQKPKPGNP